MFIDHKLLLALIALCLDIKAFTIIAPGLFNMYKKPRKVCLGN